MTMDVMDYQIFASEIQFVEVELDPNEAAIGEAGSMMCMKSGIAMDTVFGDGSAQQGGFLGKLTGAGKRLVTGESLFRAVYNNTDSVKRKVAFGAPCPGKILPMDLSQLGGTVMQRQLAPGETLMVDTGCVVAYTPDMGFDIQYVGKVKAALFGGEGLFLAKMTGPGHLWLQSLPFSRWASRIFATARQNGGRSAHGQPARQQVGGRS